MNEPHFLEKPQNTANSAAGGLSRWAEKRLGGQRNLPQPGFLAQVAD
jgi:hypothetical protein